MKLLIAPLHYAILADGGSEYSRAYEALDVLSSDRSFSGDVLVGYSKKKKFGRFKVHTMLKKHPAYISNLLRLRFIIWVFVNSVQLIAKQRYDCIWHYGPFSLSETFNPLSFLSKRPPIVIGPILTPFTLPMTTDFGQFGKKAFTLKKNIGIKVKIDSFLYKIFAGFFSSLSNLSLKRAAKVLAMEKFAQTLIRNKGVNQVSVLTLGVKTKQSPTKTNDKNRGRFVLLSVSYLIRRKRVNDLIEAMSILVHELGQKNCSLIIVGDGAEMKTLQQLVKLRKLENYVAFKGYVDRKNIRSYYKTSDIFLSASIAESMPGMYFEAMSFGLPMILSENTSSLELQKEKFGGIVVKRESPRAIAKAVQDLTTNKDMREKFSSINLKLMKSKYNLNRAIGELKRIFAEVSK